MTDPNGAPHRTPVARIDGLRVVIGGRAVVDGASLRLHPGRITALIGASGSGKTTTGLALLGEYPPGAEVQGDIRRPDGAGAIGYVPQQPAAALNPARRAGALLRDIAVQQVRAEGVPRPERRAAVRARVLKALETAQLPDAPAVLRRYPHQLSGGQQQRVVLAQALLLGARVVVADEPTTGQDALTKQRIVDELALLAREGIAVLLLSHDLDVVRELADDVVVMEDGRTLARQPAEWICPENAPDGTPPPGATPRGDGPPALFAHVRAARHRDHDRRTVRTLHDIRLTVAAGECLAVVGRSGSGKTTLARCLAGLHRDWDGEVTPAGGDGPLPHSVRARTRAQLAAVQYVFQDSRASFEEHRSVLSQAARTAVRLRGLDPGTAREEARELLSRVGLGDGPAARLPGALSGGELQRAALARALLARPRVLVCDEITSGLDVVTRRTVLRLLGELLGERGDMGLVLVTHDLPAAAALSHRLAVVDGGTVVEQGPTAGLVEDPGHPLTASLLRVSRPGGVLGASVV